MLLPWGENHRFDLVVQDEDGRSLRIQCNTGRLRNGVIRFNTSSLTYHHPSNRGREDIGVEHYSTDYRGDADLFGVYCTDNGETYLVPVDDAPLRSCGLRIAPVRNGQVRGIRWAADHRIDGPRIDLPE